MWRLVAIPRKTKRPRRLVRAAADGLAAGRDSGCDALARLRHHRPQLLTGLEDRHRPRGDFHRVSGARIACHARLALPNLERAKATNLNVMLLGERRFHGIEKGVDDPSAVLLGNQGTGSACDLCGDLLD